MKKLYLSAVFGFFIIFLLGFNVEAKEINISNLEVNSTILKTGDIHVQETIDFKINGKYNGMFRTINAGNSSGVENIKLKEAAESGEKEFKRVSSAKNGQDGVYEINTSGNKYNIKIFSPSNGKNKKFNISYDLKNAAVKYNDTGFLDYAFWGDKTEINVDKLDMSVKVDSYNLGQNLKVWFPNYNSNIEASVSNSNTFSIKGEKLKPKTPIEVKFLFPKEAVSLSKRIVNENAFNRFSKEEKNYKDEIEASRIHSEYMKKIGKKLGTAIFILNVILILFIFKIRKSKTKEYIINSFPDECTPAVAAKLYHNTIQERSLIATLLDLVRKKYININKLSNENYVLIKENNPDKNLLSHEKFLIKWFFNDIGNGLKVKMSQIKSYSTINGSVNFSKYKAWKSLVREEFNKKGYYDKKYVTIVYLLAAISAAEIFTMIIFFKYTTIISIIVGIISLYMGIFGFSLYHKKSNYGENQFRKWKYFIKNLRPENMGSIDNVDKNLVYAVALKADKNIFEDINSKIQRESINKNYDNSYNDDYYNSCIFWYFLLDMNQNDNAIQNGLNYNSGLGDSSSSGDSGFTGGSGGGFGGGGDAGGF